MIPQASEKHPKSNPRHQSQPITNDGIGWEVMAGSSHKRSNTARYECKYVIIDKFTKNLT